MNIKSFEIYPYDLPLIKPLYVRGKSIHVRQGLILHLVSDADREGFGEIAPLAELNLETLEDAQAQLESLKSVFLNQEIPDGIEKLKGKLNEWLKPFELSPSVQFGVEMALLNLRAHSKNKPLHKLFSSSTNKKIQINGLLEGNTEEVITQAQELMDEGFTAFKLKVGGDIDENIIKVSAVNNALNGEAILHLDANQSWSFDQAIQFAQGIENNGVFVDYIEEPFEDIDLIPEFFHQTQIPVALDESLLIHGFEKIKSIEGFETVIIKPTALGSIETALAILKEAQRLAIRPVISSCFESSLGILTLASLASTIKRHPIAGLDTLKYFEHDDPLMEKVFIRQGHIILPT